MTVRNAFGDSYPYSLCPVQPAMRRYAINLCTDIAEQLPVLGLTLESPGFLPYAHGYHHEFSQVHGNAWLDAMLGLCFCDACVTQSTRHGLDTIGLKQRVAGRIDRYLASPCDLDDDMARDWIAADLIHDEQLAAFLRWRMAQVTSLVAEIRATLAPKVTVAVIPSIQRPSARGWLEGSDLTALALAADSLEIPFYESSPAKLAADVHNVQGRTSGKKLRAILRPGPPDCDSRENLTVKRAILKAAGITDIAYYNFGLLRDHALDWIADER